LNIVNLGPLDEDLEALTHWHDEENAFLESQHYFQEVTPTLKIVSARQSEHSLRPHLLHSEHSL